MSGPIGESFCNCSICSEQRAREARESTTATTACLRWAAGLAIGVRGGWKATDVQQVLSAAARGEDWERVRDDLAARKGGRR